MSQTIQGPEHFSPVTQLVLLKKPPRQSLLKTTQGLSAGPMIALVLVVGRQPAGQDCLTNNILPFNLLHPRAWLGSQKSTTRSFLIALVEDYPLWSSKKSAPNGIPGALLKLYTIRVRR